MTKYRVIYQDPDNLDHPMGVLIPSKNWMRQAMEGGHLCEISVHLQMQDDEQRAKDENRHDRFVHDHDLYMKQFTGPKLGPMTEKQAIEYLCMKDLPRGCWSREHNRPMFRIVHESKIPTDRTFRNAWTLE
jgi:hypothetical protein